MENTPEKYGLQCIENTFPYPYGNSILERIKIWVQQFPYFLILETKLFPDPKFFEYDFIIGVANEAQSISREHLSSFLSQNNSEWLMGGLAYSLGNYFEPTAKISKIDSIEFPEISLFKAEIVIYKKRNSNKIIINAVEPLKIFEKIKESAKLNSYKWINSKTKIYFKSNFTETSYHEAFNSVKEHIRQGDIYEMNLCQMFSGEFSSKNNINPLEIYEKLTSFSPTPFAGLFRWNNHYLICASPERFLKRTLFDELISQPIKGTIKRSDNLIYDEILKKKLRTEKFEAENVMIVDLVRNDLYRSSKINSVNVSKLFEIQTFRKLHHLVSTITSQVEYDKTHFEILKNTFPAGSMTGAPKIRSMQLIDLYEPSGRGIYSGGIGYFSPFNTFDFNVVIRSLVLDLKNNTANFHTGGAITYDSNSKDEWEETLLKAHFLFKIFESKN